ncbi:MAG: hypothetical protein AUG75_02775 [Cyanobacteria bacterium 13_1_20CM_4_61_6]|nr:MAG: hypothetical protein AUG75_02775 [Cyanobacteria bacterium 13_1_20CM_4_61_6]
MLVKLISQISIFVCVTIENFYDPSWFCYNFRSTTGIVTLVFCEDGEWVFLNFDNEDTFPIILFKMRVHKRMRS